MPSASPKAWLLHVLSALACLLSVVSAVPVARSTTSKPPAILGPQPPHFVAYTDESQFGIPSASDLKGFNTLILSFLLASGAADQADAWTQLSASQRSSIKANYKANGITLLVSAFGSTESPTTDGKDPTALAQGMANWVKTWGMDGIDVDYEDFKAVSKGTAVGWLKTFTTVLRNNLPAGQFVITHAPVAPWFGQGQPYSQLDASVGHLIDWYNVQFYSQGTAYTTCTTLVSASGDPFPGTSVLEIVASGVPQQKVVIGKPGTPADDPHINGFLETKTLAQCLVQAKAKGWNAGVMAWEFPDANAQWIQTVRSLTWPVKQN
ncbi:glycoside hydrolase family 18 protein [Gautieria morchelliformis]|nr:glycoside hydrolase family 18 protein [Gautieria morchelliformis]